MLLFLSSADPTKFFGCELGAQTQFDTKNDRYIVNGSHEANKLQDMLDGFIRKFVLCAECDNPETDLVNISQHLRGRCRVFICFFVGGRQKGKEQSNNLIQLYDLMMIMCPLLLAIMTQNFFHLFPLCLQHLVTMKITWLINKY